jgi:lipopolysaccharide transport system ATP-binding protein
MFDEPIIQIKDLGKLYKLYPSRVDNFIDAIGITKLMPWRQHAYREFWALKGINLEVKKGQRIGIVGRNGAGKTTLLKLIVGNIPPTEGVIHVNGQVQALLQSGEGFHPEFTGVENIRASLIHHGFNDREIFEAIEEIKEFTELGQFLNQPFRSYSSGMQARLVFATATVVKPEILIIDEILGAGDAYFFGKSIERMTKLVESGATVLIVTHALDQIVRFCDSAIWLERGRVVEENTALQIVKSYTQFINSLEDRRIKAKNFKRRSNNFQPEMLDYYSNNLIIQFQVSGENGCGFDLTEARLLRNGETEERLLIGDAQDTNIFCPAHVTMNSGNWSKPLKDGRLFYRNLTPKPTANGSIVFYAFALFPNTNYEIEVTYRAIQDASAKAIVTMDGKVITEVVLPKTTQGWEKYQIKLENLISEETLEASESETSDPGGLQDVTQRKTLSNIAHANEDRTSENITVNDQKQQLSRTRWASEGPLTIGKVKLFDSRGTEQAVFNVGEMCIIEFEVLSHKNGLFKMIPAISIFRIDGVWISNNIGKQETVTLGKNKICKFQFALGPINLGDGNYVISISLFGDAIEETQRYDLIDRSYEFKVTGNDALHSSAVFQHPGQWSLIL